MAARAGGTGLARARWSICCSLICWRVLTDVSGPFDTVVLEVEAESLAQWEEARSRLFANPHFREQQRGGRELFVAGRNELYTIETHG